MNSPQFPHDPDQDSGYEVVDDPGYEVVDAPAARPRPAAPLPRPLPQARLLPAAPIPVARLVVETADDGPRKARVIHDAETVEVPRKAKTKLVRVVDDEDEDDDRPRKKKKHRKGPAIRVADDDASSNALAEWAGPAFLMLLGLVLSVVGTYGLANQPDAMVPPVAAVAFRVIGELIAIPITIVALMVIGSLFGIEYGTFGQAIRSLAAMGFLVSGLIDIFDYAGLPTFVYQPIIFMVGLGLFMTLLRLDVGEALVTMFGLNILSALFQIAMFMLIIAILASEAKKGGGFDDDLNYQDSQGQFQGDDEDFAPNNGGFGDPFGPDDE